MTNPLPYLGINDLDRSCNLNPTKCGLQGGPVAWI